jgi:hypothetical protein
MTPCIRAAFGYSQNNILTTNFPNIVLQVALIQNINYPHHRQQAYSYIVPASPYTRACKHIAIRMHSSVEKWNSIHQDTIDSQLSSRVSNSRHLREKIHILSRNEIGNLYRHQPIPVTAVAKLHFADLSFCDFLKTAKLSRMYALRTHQVNQTRMCPMIIEIEEYVLTP